MPPTTDICTNSNRTNDPDETGETQPVSIIIEDKDAIVDQIRQIKSVLFNYTCDNAEEFRKEIDEIDNGANVSTNCAPPLAMPRPS